jgi:beta-glucosidase
MEAVVVVWLALLLSRQLLPCSCASALDRGEFPDNFLFGTSTSAYQVHMYNNTQSRIR